jgi:hypothetical protein
MNKRKPKSEKAKESIAKDSNKAMVWLSGAQ